MSNFQQAVETPLVIPLNGGLNCYIFHPVTGKTLHLRTSDDAFWTLIEDLADTGYGAKLLQSIDTLCNQATGREFFSQYLAVRQVLRVFGFVATTVPIIEEEAA